MTHHFGMLLYPGLTQLDLTGPYEVLSRIPDTKIHLIAKLPGPCASDAGLAIMPTATFGDTPQLDLIFAPGGSGQTDAMQDTATLEFLRTAGARATWVTSVCTGALLLGAAGLLRGYRAATHWAYMELLPLFGAEPVHERVVIDRNRITAGGVTAGIDFGLRVAGELGGQDLAETIQLYLEYDPAPPYGAGHPRVAPAKLVEATRDRLRARLNERRTKIEQLVARP